MRPVYHGVTVRDAVLMCAPGMVTPDNVRKWISEGNVHRSRDGKIDPYSLMGWWMKVEQRYIRAAEKRAMVAA